MKFAWTIGDTVIRYVARDSVGERVRCTLTLSLEVLRADFQVRYPDTLIFMRYHQGWQTMNTYFSHKTDKPPFSIAGVHYTKGIWTHAPSQIVIPLPDSTVRFISDCGREDSEPYPSNIQFAVAVDGLEQYRSAVMTIGTPAEHVDVRVTGARFLTLTVDDGGDGYAHDHADWVNPRFITAKGDIIDAAIWVRNSGQGLNYFSMNNRRMVWHDGYAQISNPAPDCSWATMYDRTQLTSEADFYCGYLFNPPPSEFSVYSSAANSWVGIGLTKVPNAGIVEYNKGNLGMNIMWTKQPVPHDDWYTAPGITFTLVESRI